jgi:hypothetical protein
MSNKRVRNQVDDDDVHTNDSSENMVLAATPKREKVVGFFLYLFPFVLRKVKKNILGYKIY